MSAHKDFCQSPNDLPENWLLYTQSMFYIEISTIKQEFRLYIHRWKSNECHDIQGYPELAQLNISKKTQTFLKVALYLVGS